MKSASIIGASQNAIHILTVSLKIGFVYAVANVLLTLVLGALGQLSLTWGDAFIWLLTGIIICASLSPFILFSNRSRQQIILGVWLALALVRSIGLGIEGALYVPATAEYAPINVTAKIVIDFLFAWMSVSWLASDKREIYEIHEMAGSWWSWIWRVLIVGLAYFVFYFLFGSINALLYTLPFYRDNLQYGLAIPPMNVIVIAQLIRGPLFGIGAFALARLVNPTCGRLALWLGMVLFVIGGAAPYVEAVFRTMPLGFNLATLSELLCQNFPTGLVAAYLYQKC